MQLSHSESGGAHRLQWKMEAKIADVKARLAKAKADAEGERQTISQAGQVRATGLA